ncbi:MAG: enoyl-CoA hydratase-related protein [Thermodesulfobacteriota bacterium]
MEFRTLKFEEPAPGLGLLTLNRPEKLNAINLGMIEELHELYLRLCGPTSVRVVVMTGAGRGFCSGADLMDAEMLEKAPHLFADAATFLVEVQKKYSNMILELRRLPQPIIAAVNGPAAGGGMCLVLASDIVYVGPRAKFIASFINLGLSGGELGTTYFLPRLVGLSRAAEILYTGRPVGAEEAARIGLAVRLVEEDKLLESALETARTMLTKSLAGLRQTKEALTRNLNAPGLEAAIEFENRNQAICAFTGDFQKAVAAFVHKKD